MIPDEAIRLNEELRAGIDIDEMPEYYTAMGMGIEALKRYKEACENPGSINLALLPGETKEYIPRDIGKLPSDEY